MAQLSDVLVLKVANAANIKSGYAAFAVFEREGGLIGCDKSCQWSLQDNNGNIQPNHLRVAFLDNHYCIQVLGQNNVLINGASITAKSGYIRLNTEDTIMLGTIQLNVYIQDSVNLDLSQLSAEPLDIIGNNVDHLYNMIGDKQKYISDYVNNVHTVDSSINLDPLVALEQKDSLITSQENGNEPLLQSTKFSPHKTLKMNSYSNFMDLPNPAENGSSSEYIENAYVSISPLLREINSTIPLENSQDIYNILSEVGKTLKASIEGLLALQQSQNSLRDKHLRAIEDNPLRLNLDYTSTMNILFGDQKSPVHLSAPAAVAESLNNLSIHNEANKIAITSALIAILEAFSPEKLLSRFANYLRSHENHDTNPAWAWSMYENYYNELTSSRQQGFEKLFWEVYEQAYDKALRDKNNK